MKKNVHGMYSTNNWGHKPQPTFFRLQSNSSNYHQLSYHYLTILRWLTSNLEKFWSHHMQSITPWQILQSISTQPLKILHTPSNQQWTLVHYSEISLKIELKNRLCREWQRSHNPAIKRRLNNKIAFIQLMLQTHRQDIRLLPWLHCAWCILNI